MLNTGGRGSGRPGVGGVGGRSPPTLGTPPPEEFLDLVWVGPHAWAEIISHEKSLERYREPPRVPWRPARGKLSTLQEPPRSFQSAQELPRASDAEAIA